MAVIRTVLEAFDLGTDSLALWDVLKNERLVNFHLT